MIWDNATGMTSDPLEHLTPRERECLELVADNFSSKQIARKLDLSPYTVDEYIASARVKLGADSRAEAARRFSAAKSVEQTPPEELGDEPQTLVGLEENSEPSPPDRRTESRRWRIPILRQGRRFNDLTIVQRLFWIALGAVAIIILFAQLAQGMQVIESMLQGR